MPRRKPGDRRALEAPRWCGKRSGYGFACAHGRPVHPPHRGREAVAARARHLRGPDHRAAGPQQQAPGRPALAGGRGQASLRRPSEPRGPGRQGALVRGRRRPPVPHRPQGRRRPHPPPGGRLGQHARRYHRQRRTPAALFPSPTGSAPTSGGGRCARSTGSPPSSPAIRGSSSTCSTCRRARSCRARRGPGSRPATARRSTAPSSTSVDRAPGWDEPGERLRGRGGDESAARQHPPDHRRPAHPGRRPRAARRSRAGSG